MAPTPDQTREDAFLEHRSHLFSIAYRMLGTVQDAEDVLQDAFLRWTAVDTTEVRSPRAYLGTLVTRLAIDRTRAAAARRESYVGPWLPEPLVVDPAPTPEEATERSESLSLAFLVVLQTLTPLERAVFLLRHVFGYGYDDIAAAVGKSEANVRQIAHRAREHVEARRPRFAPPEEQRRVAARFAEAVREGDLDEMLALLDADVVLRSDGGGKVRAARRPVAGADRVARFILGISEPLRGVGRAEEVTINAQPGVLMRVGDELLAAVSYAITDGRIADVFIVVNPDKLAAIAAGPKEVE